MIRHLLPVALASFFSMFSPSISAAQTAIAAGVAQPIMIGGHQYNLIDCVQAGGKEETKLVRPNGSDRRIGVRNRKPLWVVFPRGRPQHFDLGPISREVRLRMVAPPASAVAVDVTAVDAQGQPITKLDSPARLTLDYGECDTRGRDLVVIQDRREVLRGTHDPAESLYTVEVNHLSLFELAWP